MLNKPSCFNSLDDLLFATYQSILQNGVRINSKRDDIYEITQFAATLKKPRIRTSMSLDRKLVKSKFAEFAWYLSRDSKLDFITPYIEAYNQEEQENNRILGAYGPKIFSSNGFQKSQYERIIEQIAKREATKQAYLVISEIKDYRYRSEQFKSPPCTIGLHFFVRNDSLNLAVYMRSNDAYLGLPHDLFCFTMLQELVSCRTGIPLGTYTHYATSMHVYNKHMQRVKQYLDEGIHEPIEMPKIKICDNKILDLVSQEFNSGCEISNFKKLDQYWKDFSLFSNKNRCEDKDNTVWKNKFSNDKMKRIATNSIAN